MLLVEYAEELKSVTDAARFLSQLDILDVAFENGHSLELYVANTQEQRVRGLSNLSSIDADGMMFYYDVSTWRPYSMKDMLFDLEIGWYDAKGKLLDVGLFSAGEKFPVLAKYSFNYIIEAQVGRLPFSNLQLGRNNG